MKVTYANCGGPIILKPSGIKRWNGSLESYLWLWLLTRNPSIDELYTFSSDWEKISEERRKEIDPRGVVRNHIRFEGIPKVDWAFIKGSYGWGRVNRSGTVWKNDKETFTPLAMQQNYAGHCVKYLNESKVPYIMTVNDPRTIAASKGVVPRYDTINKPFEIMTQLNGEIIIKSIKEYVSSFAEQQFIEERVPLRYAKVECLESIFYEDECDVPKYIDFTMVAMQDVGTGIKKSRRFDIMEEYVLKQFPNVKVYGRWDEYYTSKYPNAFAGLILDHNVMDDIMRTSKYTYVIGIGTEWSTSKWALSISTNTVPFIANDYDTQYNIIPKDHFIRIKSPEDLKSKIEYLNNNDNKRLELLKELKDTLFKDVRNGIFLYKEINKSLSKIGIQIAEYQ